MCGKCIPLNVKTATALTNYSKELSHLMKEFNVTDAQVAQYIGCDRKTILAIRKGCRFPKLDQMVMIADFFEHNLVYVPFDHERTV